MKLQSTSAVVAILVAFLLQSCALPAGEIAPTPAATIMPTSSCDSQPTGNWSSFQVTVKNAQWKESVSHPSYGDIPRTQLSMMGVDPKQKPVHAFLVVDLRVINVSKAPVAWHLGGHYFHNFHLVASDGTRYQFNPELSEFVRRTPIEGLNPGLPIEGAVVFDVPRDNYTFYVMQEVFTSLAVGYRSIPVFACTVTG